MSCEPVPGGGFACSRGRRRSCSVPGCTNSATLLCDYPLKGPKAGKTCDRDLCVMHAARRGHQTFDGRSNTVDYCPAHAAEKVPA